MTQKVYTIYEAKTQLSKLGKRAAAGETIFVGARGNAQFMLLPVTKPPQRQLGVWDGRKHIDYSALDESNAEIAAWLEGDE